MYSWFSADLHIHTVLSPCAELEMGPKNIVTVANELGLDLIAITDHNGWENVPAVMEQAARVGRPVVIPGMEVETKEEVHLVCLFPDLTCLQEFGSFVNSVLPRVPNQPDVFGDQVVVNREEEIVRFVDNLLITPCTASLEEVVEEVAAWGGVVVPAHVDRPSFSILANLGFIPAGLQVPALEIAFPQRLSHFLLANPSLAGCRMVAASDAHCLDRWRKWDYRTYFYLREPSFTEVLRALRGEEPRKVVIDLQNAWHRGCRPI